MGRLVGKITLKYSKFAQQWLLPVGIALVLIFGAHTTIFAARNPSRGEIADYLQHSELEVDEEAVDGYTQAYYVFDGRRYFITDQSTNHTEVQSSGRYIVWLEESSVGSARVVLHDILSGVSTRLTHGGSHQQPLVVGNKVVWQGWDVDRWQIFYYDGQQVAKISAGDPSTRADFNGNEIVYAQKGIDSMWRVKHYDVTSKQTSDLYEATGKGVWPHFENGEIKVEYYDQIKK